MRPFLSGRDYHHLHAENGDFRFRAETEGEWVRWQPYAPVPGVRVQSNGEYQHEPIWYRNFFYSEEADRGLDSEEDLASPGLFVWNLHTGEAVWLAEAELDGVPSPAPNDSARTRYEALRAQEESRRTNFTSHFDPGAETYLIRSGSRRTIIAGYPWFTDWGRDTFISLRGLCLARNDLDLAREIVLSWADTVSAGMLPNRFPDSGGTPEYNSVDASLWYVVAVGDFLTLAQQLGFDLAAEEVQKLRDTVKAILVGYRHGTRYNIHADEDGLISAGEPGVQLTWMDAKVGDWVVTPRIGKPVEIQALWLNALQVASAWDSQWAMLFEVASRSLTEKFWNAEQQCLYDVIDVEHRVGEKDASIRPNQIFAVGGLPLAVLAGERATSVVRVVEEQLWTPLGLRSLSPGHPEYRGRYEGDIWQRDGSYHQGTVWLWLLGPFVEAWLRVRGDSPEVRQQAQQRFLEPMAQHLEEAGLGHLSEIADGDSPHTPRGCPFQAWSLGEYLRLGKRVETQ